MAHVFIVLAAGQGKRMKSDLPKVLHRLEGRPMLDYVLAAVGEVDGDGTYVVVGYGADVVKEAFADRELVFVLQQPQLGTGHAVKQCERFLRRFDGSVVVLNGDTPALRAGTIAGLIAHHEQTGAAATVLTAAFPDPTGYGRIVRDDTGNLLRIVEDKDATAEEKRIAEINSGLFCFERGDLFSALEEVDRENTQGEYYLTDTIAVLRERGRAVGVYRIEDPWEVAGVNTEEELRRMEVYLKGRKD